MMNDMSLSGMFEPSNPNSYFGSMKQHTKLLPLEDVMNQKPTEKPEPGFKWVQSLMSGKWIQIEENTPLCCDPSRETYWSM